MLHPVPRPPPETAACASLMRTAVRAQLRALRDVTSLGRRVRACIAAQLARDRAGIAALGPRPPVNMSVRKASHRTAGRRQGAVSHIASPCGRSCGRPTLCRADSDTLFRVQ
jgi:hypothetical protein